MTTHISYQKLINSSRRHYAAFEKKPKGKVALLRQFGAIVAIRGEHGKIIMGCWPKKNKCYGYVPLLGNGVTVEEIEKFFGRKWSRIV